MAEWADLSYPLAARNPEVRERALNALYHGGSDDGPGAEDFLRQKLRADGALP